MRQLESYRHLWCDLTKNCREGHLIALSHALLLGTKVGFIYIVPATATRVSSSRATCRFAQPPMLCRPFTLSLL